MRPSLAGICTHHCLSQCPGPAWLTDVKADTSDKGPCKSKSWLPHTAPTTQGIHLLVSGNLSLSCKVSAIEQHGAYKENVLKPFLLSLLLTCFERGEEKKGEEEKKKARIM